jgi:hypothetical protein
MGINGLLMEDIRYILDKYYVTHGVCSYKELLVLREFLEDLETKYIMFAQASGIDPLVETFCSHIDRVKHITYLRQQK